MGSREVLLWQLVGSRDIPGRNLSDPTAFHRIPLEPTGAAREIQPGIPPEAMASHGNYRSNSHGWGPT